jgi:acetyl esterase/lipase
VSGIYRIPPGSFGFTLGGDNPLALRFDEAAPIRGVSNRDWTGRPGVQGFAMTINIFGPVFGDDPKARVAASPVNHVRTGLPPFLILYAENDLPSLAGMAVEFQKSLANQGCEAWLSKVNNRNHNSILFQAIEPEDAAARMMIEFVRRQGAVESKQRSK